MSQEKINNYKQQKYNRKKAHHKESKLKTYAGYAAATLVAVAFIGYMGYSILISTGAIKLEEPTTKFVSTVSAKDLREKLIASGDPNVKGIEETTSTSETTTEEASESATTAK